jgi:Ferredoxin-like domain in Api92-like protein
MPNWVITKIYITGPEDKIKEFEGKCLRPNRDEDGEFQRTFSFDRIKQRPEELVNTISPSPKPEVRKVKDMQGNEIVVEVYRENINNATPDQQEELRRKYGHSNWYDWNCNNWGTKWDCSDSHYTEEDKILQFQTAWACPDKIIAEMKLMFPDLKFNGNYADEDLGSNVGYIEEGLLYPLDDLSEEAYETAATLWGYEGYYDDEKKEWIFDGEEEEEDE